MDCHEARKLIDQGLRPGSQTPPQAALGFHLSRCAACRAYRQQTEALLNQLLSGSDSAPPPAWPIALASPDRSDAPIHPTATPAPPPARAAATRSSLLLPGLAVVLVVVLLTCGWAGGIAWRTYGNLSAMVVTPVPTPEAAAPARVVPAVASPAAALPAVGLTPEGVPVPTALRGALATPTATVLPEPMRITPLEQLWEPDLLPSVQPAGAQPPAQPGLPNSPDGAVSQAWTPIPDDPAQAAPAAGMAATILILGSDRRPDEGDLARTDVVMLVRVDPQEDRVALLSLPRDLWVPIPGYGANRVNMAYFLAEQNAPGSGFDGARQTVSSLLGVPVDYVLKLDFLGFIGLIDELGGVSVNVEKELYDARFPTMDYGYTVAHFLPGVQHMDGLTALTYSRIRHPDSDFMRIRRQQAVVEAVGVRLRERGHLQTLFTIDRITGTLREYVRTDMSQARLIALAWDLRNLDVSRVEHYTVDENMVAQGTVGDPYALSPYMPSLDVLARSFMGTP